MKEGLQGEGQGGVTPSTRGRGRAGSHQVQGGGAGQGHTKYKGEGQGGVTSSTRGRGRAGSHQVQVSAVCSPTHPIHNEEQPGVRVAPEEHAQPHTARESAHQSRTVQRSHHMTTSPTHLKVSNELAALCIL